MVQLSPEQRANLVKAVKSYKASKAKLEAAQKEVDQKLANLKTCSQSTGQEAQVMAESMTILGHVYLELELQES